MPRPCRIPDDPAVYNQMLEDLAYGIPQVRIAEALKVPKTTLHSWLKRKDFRTNYAIKLLETLRNPIKAVADRFPLQFIERHPETRETFAPPTQKIQSSQTHEVLVKLEFAPGNGRNGGQIKQEKPIELECQVVDHNPDSLQESGSTLPNVIYESRKDEE